MNTDNIQAQLRAVANNDEDSIDHIIEMMALLKEQAVTRSDEVSAKHIWCLEQISRVQQHYISAFNKMKAEAYYNAWCDLEKSEIAAHHLRRHFTEQDDEYHIAFVMRHIELYQSLFPYRIFGSPEYVNEASRCSICDSPASIRKPCDHRVGEIYMGTMCCRVIERVSIVGWSLVRNPAQKYSVMFADGKDNFDYSLVRYIAERLVSPFHDWDVEVGEKQHSHSLFKEVGRNGKCPCGSRKKYKKCCLPEEGVLMPHYDFWFEVPPEQSLETINF